MKVAEATTACSWCPQRPGSMVPGSQSAAPLCTTSGSIVPRRSSTPTGADDAQTNSLVGATRSSGPDVVEGVRSDLSRTAEVTPTWLSSGAA